VKECPLRDTDGYSGIVLESWRLAASGEAAGRPPDD